MEGLGHARPDPGESALTSKSVGGGRPGVERLEASGGRMTTGDGVESGQTWREERSRVNVMDLGEWTTGLEQKLRSLPPNEETKR